MKIKGFNKLTKKKVENLGKEAVACLSLKFDMPKLKTKKENKKLVTVKAPVGSLIIAPHKIRKTFKEMFGAGLHCGYVHSHGYNPKSFNHALNKIIKSYSKIKPK